MDQQRTWLRARRKGRMRVLAVILCVCVLFTTYPDILETLSVFASEQSDGRYISGFAALADEIKEQTVPVGTMLTQLSLPDTLEAVVTGQPSEDSAGKPNTGGGDGEEDSRENDGEETGGDTSGIEAADGSTKKTEEGEPSGTEQGNTETDSESEDKDTEDGEDTQPEEDGESGKTGGSTETDNGDAADMEKVEGSEGESAFLEEQEESATTQETHTVTMQEYYTENVVSIQTLEKTSSEEQEETVTINGVTWQSEPEYDGSMEGTYTFTAVLPDGYILADGVSLPEITVTVESTADAMIRALLDRLAALPDAEEYLAIEPDMEEDEDVYREWEEKLYEYAEEALAILEKYEALTKEQQTQIPEEELTKLTTWVEIARMPREDTMMLATAAGTHEHNGVIFQEWSGTDSLPSAAGNYCLKNDVMLVRNYEIPGDINLCLCGQKIEGNVSKGMIRVNGYALNIYDCRGNGKIYCPDINNPIQISQNGVLSLYGGTIQSEKRSAIPIGTGSGDTTGGIVNIYSGASVIGGSNGIYVNQNLLFSQVNVYGGTISGTTSINMKNGAGNIIIHDDADISSAISTVTSVKAVGRGQSGLNKVYTIKYENVQNGTIVVQGSTDDTHYKLDHDTYSLCPENGNLTARVVYTVTLTGNGGSGTQLERYGSGIETLLPADWTKAGYTFEGWYENSDFSGSKVTSISTAATGNKTYYAKWTANQYGITYSGLDNATLTTKPTQHTYGTATKVGNPTKTGYTFAGWKVNDGTTTTKDLSLSATGYTAAITLTATWTANQYKVTFNYQGATDGNDTTKKNVIYDNTYGMLPVPTRTGWKFAGWFAQTGGKGSQVTAATTVRITSDQTLYACWTEATPPDKPVLQDGVTLPAGWTNMQDTIPLKLYDSEGVTELWVSIDGKAYIKVDSFTPRTGSMTYDYKPVTEGEHTYRFKAVDAADNVSVESDIFTVKLDKTKPVIGTSTYENEVHLNLWNWIIGKTSMIIHVPVTDSGSGVTEIRYTLTPKDTAGNFDSGNAVEKTTTVKEGKAEITFDADFRGTITINCTDAVGNKADSVTIGKDAGGVIAEDRAPDITTDAKTDYYETVSAINVTVKDDMENAITAGIAAITYKVDDGTAKSVTFDKSAMQTEVTFAIPAAEIPTGITEITVTASDNAGNTATKSFTVKIKGPEKTPAAEIDYKDEKLTKLVPGEKYDIGGTEYTADGTGCIPIIAGWFNSTISIVKKGNGSETTDSAAQSLTVPARPQKPAPTGADVSTAGGTGKLTGLKAGTTYEISADGGKTWVRSETADGNGEIKGLAPGTYTVRVKAGTTNFVSENSDPVKIGAYQVKVTFMANGENYKTISVDYGAALTGIPAVPPKKDAGDQVFAGEWCADEQGSRPAVFTNITADMTVYAVYTKGYTVTLQGGTGCTLSAAAGSVSPVKEGGSFTFRFALADGYQKNGSFAVKVNGVKVELTEDNTYTISDIRENKTVTVEGVEKKPGGKPTAPGGGNKEDGQGSPSSEPSDDTPPAKTITPAPGIASPEPDKEPAGRKPQGTSEQEKSGKPKKEHEPEEEREPEKEQESEKGQEPEGAGTQETGSADTGQPEKELQAEKKEVKIGNGTVIVTVVYEKEKCSAAVADAEAAVKAVLTPAQQELVNDGATIEIRIDVTDISDKVPPQDKAVIEKGIEAYREEVPGLTLGVYVDISMFIRIGEGDWNAITETKEPVEVAVGIPENLQSDGREYYIIRAHNGAYTFMDDLDAAPDTITISTDMFSSYAIAYVETDGTGTGGGTKCGLCHICPTFLGVCCFIWLAVVIAGIILAVIILRRKKDEDKEKAET